MFLHLDPKNINISIVSANLFNTTIIIVLLYMRKLYLFSKISRKILKDRRLNMEGIRCEPFNDNYQQYGGKTISSLALNSFQRSL